MWMKHLGSRYEPKQGASITFSDLLYHTGLSGLCIRHTEACRQEKAGVSVTECLESENTNMIQSNKTYLNKLKLND